MVAAIARGGHFFILPDLRWPTQDIDTHSLTRNRLPPATSFNFNAWPPRHTSNFEAKKLLFTNLSVGETGPHNAPNIKCADREIREQ